MRLTRGGPSMEQPAGWQAEVSVESSDASETRGERRCRPTAGTRTAGLTFSSMARITMQPAPQWQLSISPEYERERRHAAVRHDARRRRAGDLRRPLHLRAHRPLDLLDADPAELHVQAGPDARFLRGAVCRQRPLRPHRRARRRADAAAAAVRHRRDDVDDAGRRQSAGHRRRDELHAAQPRLQRAVLPQQPGAALGMARRAARCTSCGSRIGKPEETAPHSRSLADMFSSFGRRGDNFFAIKSQLLVLPAVAGGLADRIRRPEGLCPVCPAVPNLQHDPAFALDTLLCSIPSGLTDIWSRFSTTCRRWPIRPAAVCCCCSRSTS